MTNERSPLLIDTDPGVDDALAILMAHAHPDARIAALTEQRDAAAAQRAEAG